ncbi:UDP-glycosyltransferase 79B3-like [Cornus florida]|uniref:UDP-glycosyltransferase 79B3-like n=1 Tax=Cornus florida TaxID=4283 RepID=UPI0028989C55|nr:UDP-glycosyltransferase 79B3-like [Cornus florida]
MINILVFGETIPYNNNKKKKKMAECKDSLKFHIAMFPWFAFGHMTPYLHLANQLAERGHNISFLLPKKAQLQLQTSNLHPHLITFHAVAVPHVQGLPPGTETASEIPILLNGLLATAMDLTRDQVEALLRVLKPDFVFYDFAYWIPAIASEIGSKTIHHSVVSPSCMSLLTACKVPMDEANDDQYLLQPPPGYPSSTVLLNRHEARTFLSYVSVEFGIGLKFYERLTTARKECNAISIRTCQELEGPFCDYIGSQFGKPVLLTGPVLLPAEPAAKTRLETDGWGKWLDGFEPGSVVFCAFGSQCVLENDQFQEIILGFELTGLPFLVAAKPPSGLTSVEEAFPEGFEERVKGRGVVYGGWVDQPAILGHPSVGCFVSHCGFGSMWEALLSDNQIVLVPHSPDQILNARLMAQELKVAVEVERDENGLFPREKLCKAIKCVMDKESEEGGMVKKNHQKWKETLTRQGFMSGYIDKFVQNLQQL